ncbi:MAG: hypothetical protein HZB70_01245 [Candidatus Berkelbacteria bacterium]|nr:MAG: hypothetical protein HZB70_01245 [Candidatus Berkelbacteria bacterium]QQG52035.1 MAG: hypothetical protein HY845_01750 [Candidatus Berkelbacteria bacterium]
MIEFGRLPFSGAEDLKRHRERLLQYMTGQHAEACLDRLLDADAKIVAISYTHGREFGKGEAIYFVMSADESSVMVMNTDENKLTGTRRGSLRGAGENLLTRYLLDDNLSSLRVAAQ